MTKAVLPRARVDGLIVQPLPPDEVLVYDKNRHAAHCLNKSAALVWQACNGHTTLEEAAELLQREVSIATREGAEDTVWVALDRLSRSYLLQEEVTPPAIQEGMSRREFVRKVAVGVAIGLPIVASIVSPKNALAGSLPIGASCNANSDCASGCCKKQEPHVCKDVGSGACLP